ncbi:nucleotide exchange factor GrpE [Selenomonadales bacterium OttesenSCG-928-I06]|nr:nucleotide exchange factor GrpE [Selenomonadales bacterium OttesenSCG-928-I06]
MTDKDNEKNKNNSEEILSSEENSQDDNLLFAQLEEKERLLNEQIDKYRRLQADFENFKRRTRLEKEELSGLVARSIVLKLLPVLDNFERAMNSQSDQESFGTGVEMILKQLQSVFENLGVQQIDALDCQFDPNLHEAVMRIQDSDKEEGIIINEVQKGYILNGKVIRHSMVNVAGN